MDELFKTQLGKLLNPPVESEASKMKYKTIFVHLDGKKKRDIWFSGFGFVSIKGECDIDCKVLESTEVYFTNAIIG